MAYLRARNPALDQRFSTIALHYAYQGRELGLRWDYAFFQMIVETGSLTFQRGDGRPGAVSPAQNNFAGLGATGGREAGESFGDVGTGVRAHLQHLQLYAGDTVAAPVAERTRKVQDWGLIATWHRSLRQPARYVDLANKWAPGSRSYSAHIESVARRFFDEHCALPDPEPIVADVRHPLATRSGAAPAVAAARQAIETKPGNWKEPRSALGAGAMDARPVPPTPPAQHYAVAAMAPLARPAPAPAPSPSAITPQPARAPAPPPATVRRPTAEEAADENVRRLVTGRTVLLDTPIGTVIPIEFTDDGVMKGKAGGLAGYLGAAQDEGQWWIEKAKLCQRWNVWFKGEQQCLKFKQAGQTIHWVSDNGKSGTARLAP